MPHVLLVAGLAAAGVLLVLKFDPVRSDRAQHFRTTTVECTRADQPCESLIGFGSGGVVGVGFGRGTQKLGHLPEAYSDFLLSVIGEEWGLRRGHLCRPLLRRFLLDGIPHCPNSP